GARCWGVLLCQSREELDDAHRLGLRPRLGAYYVGNGINLRRFRARLAPPDHARPILLCVGRLEPVKNHGMLFGAVDLLRRSHDPVLWLVGDGPSRTRCESHVRRLGLAHSVRFLGYRYDIAELTAAADVAVLHSG